MKSVLVVGSGNAFCSSGRAQTCFLLEETGGQTMLLDFGATSLMQMNRMGIDVGSVDRLLVTHFHGDHIGGIPFLLLHLQYIARRTKPFQLIGPAGLSYAVQRIFDAMYEGVELSYELHFTECADGMAQEVGPFNIEAVAMAHKPESLGYRIVGGAGRTFAFSGDTGWCDALQRLYADVDVGMIELSLERQPEGGTSHLALDEIIKGRHRLGARRLFFSHIYDDLARLALQQNERHLHFGLPVTDGLRIEF